MLPILFLDDDLVAIHKPAKLLVHRSPVDRHEKRFAVQLLREQLGSRVYPVHRLDKATSGVLLFARNAEVGRRLNAAFAARAVHKTYLAVVRGQPPESGEIDYLLPPITERGDGAAPPAAPQPALTRYRRLACVDLPHRVDRYPSSRYSLLEIEPISGRRHQIRRHLKHVSHPIIGDTTYGKGAHNRLFRELFACDRLLLACVSLSLTHPVSGASLRITAPLAPEFSDVMRQLGWVQEMRAEWIAY